MRSIKNLLVLSCLLSSSLIQAQYKKVYEDLFQQTSGWPMSGWLAGIGATYTLPANKLQHNYRINSTVSGDFKTYSFPGIYAELGRFHLVPAGIIFNNIDYSVAFKQMHYRQNFSGTSSATGLAVIDKASWEDQNAALNFNLNSVIQIGDFQWIQPTLGIHGDYRFGGKQIFSSDSASFQYVLPGEKLNVQLHAKIAYGLKLTSELFIVPSLEIGLWRLNNLTELRIPKTVFNSNYTPVIFCVKFLLHRPFNLKPCKINVEEVDLSKTKRRKKKVRLF